MKKITLTSCIALILLATSSVNLYPQAVSISRSAPHDPIKLTVLPVKNVSDEINMGFIITDNLIRELSKSDLVEPIPLHVMVETLWEYFPSYFSVTNPSIPYTPSSIELFGTLQPVEKLKVSTFLNCQYTIDGIFTNESGTRRIILDLYSCDDRRIVQSFTAHLSAKESVYEATNLLVDKINGYFFNRFADQIVLNLLQNKVAKRISFNDTLSILNSWLNQYGDNLYIHAGIMMIIEDEQNNASQIIDAGDKWFLSREKNPNQQIRFFQSSNANPYLILGRAYIITSDYSKAKKILSSGSTEFPFNTQELLRQLTLCERMLNDSGKNN